jgi:peptidylprolyl isomerase
VIVELLAAAALAPAQIPPAEAFSLPSANRCVMRRRLTLRLRAGDWESATVRVDGRRVARVTRAGRIRLTDLPRRRFVLTIRATASDGRTARAERTYQPCIDTKPAITVPAGDPPRDLELRDIARGSGREAKRPRDVTVHYVLVTWSDGQEADSSWSRREPFTFPLGKGAVIKGFERGILGMKVGGRREIVVPPRLGYGAAGAPPVVDPDETLVFVVDLISVR